MPGEGAEGVLASDMEAEHPVASGSDPSWSASITRSRREAVDQERGERFRMATIRRSGQRAVLAPWDGTRTSPRARPYTGTRRRW